MVIFIIYLGLCFGSFISVAYYRFSPSHSFFEFAIAISYPRSNCRGCQKGLKLWHLIPLFSWLLLKGRCYYCHCKIAYRYLILEIMVSLLFLLIYLNNGLNFRSIVLMWLACYFLLLSMIDIQFYLLPDFFTLPLMWLGIIAAYFELFDISLRDAVAGIVIGYLLLTIPAGLFYLITNKQGLGQGDIKLLAALGSWLPYQTLPLILMCSSILGIIYYLILRFIVRLPSLTIIPFGPFLLIPSYFMCYSYL